MKFFTNHRNEFLQICESNRLTIDFDTNREGFHVFISIFKKREYADFFPFYEKAVILDVGAHFGYFSLFAERNCGPGSRIVAIEPDQKNFGLLTKNLFDSKSKMIETINCAMAHEEGAQKLFKGRSINSSLIENYALNPLNAEYELTKVMSLQGILASKQLDHVDFMKLDCEGAEYDILLRASDETLSKIKTISMEFHDMLNPDFTANKLYKRLSNAGYKIVKFVYDETNLGLNYGKIIATRL